MPLNICLSLAKYSHSPGRTPTDTSWNHLSASDLCIVLKGGDDDSLVMLLFHGTTTLETIDIGSYLKDANRIRRQAMEVIGFEQPPIEATRGGPILRLRYFKPDGQTHKVQVTFHSEEQCQQIVQSLEIRGMPVKVQPPKNSIRPDTFAGRSNLARSDARLLTTNTNSPFFPQVQQMNRPNTLHAPDLEVAGLSRRLASRPCGGDSGSWSMLPPHTVTTQEPIPSRLSMPQLWQTQTSKPSTQHPSPNKTVTDRPASKLHRADLDTIRQAAAKHGVCSGEGYHDRPSSMSRPPAWQMQQWLSKNNGSSSEPTERPFTAASRASSVLELPPLPKPRLVPDQSATSSTAPSLPRLADSQSSRPSSALPTLTRTEDIYSLQHHGLNSESTLQAEREATPNDSGPASGKPLSMTEPGPIGKRLSERSRNSNAPRMSSDVDAPHELVSPQSANNAASKVCENTASLSPTRRQPQHESVERAYAAIKSSSYSAEAVLLDQYVVQSPEDREAALDQFMIENLENPTFATLCEDVESCWRRIALGL